MSQLQKRLGFSAVFVSIAVFTIFYAPMWGFVAVVEALVLLSLNEYFSMVAKKGMMPNRLTGLFIGATIPVATYLGPDFLALAGGCLILLVINFRKGFQDRAIVSPAVTLFGLVYIAWFFSHAIDLRQLAYGSQWVFYVALVVKGGDAGAYFIGKKYGKRKLMEHVSPNKSVEGAIAGLATSVILSLISRTFIPVMPFHHFFLLGIITGVIAQLGDLAESLLKRDAGIKDSGTIPGLGGVLDMLDSLVLTIPFVYYYVSFFSQRELWV